MSARYLTFVLVALCSGFAAPAAQSDEFRPAYLELREVDAETYDVLWKVPARGTDLRLGLYVAFPHDSVNLSEPRGVLSGGAYVERWRVRHAGGLVGQTLRIDGLAGSVSDVLVRVERLDGTAQMARVLPSNPLVVVEASAGKTEVAANYLELGVEHILLGIDHLLFVLVLLLIVKGVRRVIVTITAFTIAHSITLAAATLGIVKVAIPPVEAVIALSIVFVAAEIVHGLQGRAGITARWPWVVAFTFGLLHGFGFASALGEVGLPQHAIPLALLFFNLGVELGQLLFVGAFMIGTWVFARCGLRWPRWAEYVSAYAVGGIAMFWVIERVAGF
jgi:hydrogenase/urease accessory protein HupE